jgi:hypothetical protein
MMMFWNIKLPKNKKMNANPCLRFFTVMGMENEEVEIPQGLLEVVKFFTNPKTMIRITHHDFLSVRELLPFVDDPISAPSPDYNEDDVIDKISIPKQDLESIHKKYWEFVCPYDPEILKKVCAHVYRGRGDEAEKEIQRLCFVEQKFRNGGNREYWKALFNSSNPINPKSVWEKIRPAPVGELYLDFNGSFDDYIRLFQRDFPEYSKLLHWSRSFEKKPDIDTLKRFVSITSGEISKRIKEEQRYYGVRLLKRWGTTAPPAPFIPFKDDYALIQVTKALGMVEPGQRLEGAAEWIDRVNKKALKGSRLEGRECLRLVLETQNIHFRGETMSILQLVDIAHGKFRYILDPRISQEELAGEACKILQGRSPLKIDEKYREWDPATVMQYVPNKTTGTCCTMVTAVSVFFKWRDAYFQEKLVREWEKSEAQKLVDRDPRKETLEQFAARKHNETVRTCAITGESIPPGQETQLLTFSWRSPMYRTVLSYLEKTRLAWKASKEGTHGKKRKLGDISDEICECCDKKSVKIMQFCKQHAPKIQKKKKQTNEKIPIPENGGDVGDGGVCKRDSDP